jgi:Fic family protein
MNNFKAGGYQNQGSYKSFMPTFINRNWIINNMSVISLLSKADRCVGKLDMFSQYVPNIDLFISMHIIKEATKSSNIEGTQTTVADALQNIEDVYTCLTI